MNTQYIFITNSAKSSFGEGIFAAALANRLSARGYNVTVAKYDNYLNTDAASFDPELHFECFVTADGHETDCCLGHYERIAGIETSKRNHITAGQIMQSVINNERRGAYMGEMVTAENHLTNELMQCIGRLANNGNNDIAIIEVGGCSSDLMSHIMLCAIGKMQSVMGNNCLCINCVADCNDTTHTLEKCGIRTDITLCDACNCKNLAHNANLSNWVSLELNGNIYDAPHLLAQSQIEALVAEKLALEPIGNGENMHWEHFATKAQNAQKSITIAIIGNLNNNEKAYLNLNEALKICGWHCNTNVVLKHIASNRLHSGNVEEMLYDADAIIAAPGIASKGIEGYIEALRWCRTNNIPTLGIALGMQCMAIELARNVLGLADANTTEVNANVTHNVVDLMLEQKQMAYMPESIRLGTYPCHFMHSSLAAKAYGGLSANERHRHRMEFNNKYRDLMLQAGVIFSGITPNAGLVDIIEVVNNQWYLGCSFQPEFSCTAFAPNKLLMSFIDAANYNKEQKQ